jgi:hydrogenase maturation protease
MIAPFLVLGWGNLSRGDDALGPLFVAALHEQLPSALRGQVEFLDDYQLQIEHALDLVGRRQVLFVDASVEASAPFEVTVVQPSMDTSYTTHSLSPQALLQVYQNLHGEAPPPCLLLAIQGDHFELGEPPSARALKHLACAVAWAQKAVSSGDAKGWMV